MGGYVKVMMNVLAGLGVTKVVDLPLAGMVNPYGPLTLQEYCIMGKFGVWGLE